MFGDKEKPVILYTADDREINVRAPHITSIETYPSDWFKEQNTKPSVVIPEMDKDTTIEVLYATVYGDLEENMSTNTVKAYLYKYFETITYTLKEDWVSYGQLIGGKDQEITPLDLLRIVKGDKLEKTRIAKGVTQRGERTAMALICLFPCRLINITYQTYIQTLCKSITTQLSVLGLMDDTLDIGGLQTKISFLGADPDIKKLCAALDMFLNKTNLPYYSILRLATIASRFKDCTALMALHRLRNLLGLPISKCVGYFMTTVLLRDLISLMKSEEEIDKEDSYLPYSSDFGLFIKSPYSAANRPNITLFVHAIGAFLREEWSLNAIHPTNATVMPVLQNAAYVIAALNLSIKLTQQVYKEKRERRGDKKEGPKESESPYSEYPSSSDADEWCEWITVKHGGILPAELWQDSINSWASIEDSREKSIGMFLSKIAKSLAHIGEKKTTDFDINWGEFPESEDSKEQLDGGDQDNK